jgi:DNA-binding NtrC family response regulator
MDRAAVLIIDDDPSHLRIYGWILQAAGYCSLSALVTRDHVELPDAPIELVLLDYHLNGRMSAAQVAKLVKNRFPGTRIVVLSDALVLPDDVAPLVDGFVRKGDPERLVEAVSQALGVKQ